MLAHTDHKNTESVHWKENCLWIDPCLFEQPVTLFPPSHVALRVNGAKIQARCVLTADDVVTLPYDPQQLDDWVYLNISKNGLEASLQLIEDVAYELIPVVSSGHNGCEIRFKEQRRQQLPFTTEELVTWLKQKGVVYGVSSQRIDDWLRQETYWSEPYIIATGKQRQDGQPTQFKKLYTTLPNEGVEVQEKESINWFGVHEVESVQIGDKVIEIVPPSKGTNGINVFGQEIPAIDGKEIPIRLGQGVKLSEDGRFVVATMDGRVELNKGQVRINPLFEIKGDLTLEEGSIRFNGDVTVHGDVLEGLMIEATGNVEVKGSVTHGKIVAGQHVAVRKNIIGSEVTAGGQASQAQLILERMKTIVDQVDTIRKGLQQISAHLDVKHQVETTNGLGRVVKLLIESKLKHLETYLKRFEQECKHWNDPSQELTHWAASLIEKLTGLGPLKIQSKDEIEHLYRTGKALMEDIAGQGQGAYHVSARYIHNSAVRASGNICVQGLGVYNSTLFAAHDILIIDGTGVARGGRLEAGHRIKVKRLGAPANVKTYVRVNQEDGQVSAEYLYPDVTIEINGISYHNQREQSLVKMCYDRKTHSLITV
ncbi:uncharacterized protein (DUF342 family) [Caldalkalibacillus uzonensis]|uniref:Uncharacterized protein (DUF342 family) n=1 Tax=Caldalkalibacillus uzonensis TaxID=353224 RepID=A0ABU0CRD4_9BACI|nr:FapA family protein [Caldalkalibacillus uzonensis]MDQ0338983.1 uncharacterized protein (DUF342 family) [Caldalkalibacillus uzonensis]